MNKPSRVSSASPSRHFAVVGAGMAGVACARTLMQAGHQVTVFEKGHDVGGRMTTRTSAFGTFDEGTQYFTVRDPRFARALDTVPSLCRPWSANAVRVLDAHGQVAEIPRSTHEPHWVPSPGMNALLQQWAQPLAAAQGLRLQTQVIGIEPDALTPRHWQLRTAGASGDPHVFAGFAGVILALPSASAQALLAASSLAPALASQLDAVQVAPCWTLMAAYPQASQPGLLTLGPQWNAARSTHHRIAWLARESSKPGRGPIERWTVQASAAWSQEHLEDEPARVEAKLLKAFGEVTGIVAPPAWTAMHRWRQAQTLRPLGRSHLWDAQTRIGLCGDWCLGDRVEDAFLSGLELALKVD